MDLQIIFLTICSIAVQTVTSINIEGPPLTIYRPCGLSVLHFKNIHGKTWQGLLDFGPDQNSDDVDAVISFKKANTLRMITKSNNVTVYRPNYRIINIHAQVPVLEPIIFEVTLHGSVHKVPYIADLTLNDDIICNDEIKSSFNLSAPVNDQFQDVCGNRSPDHEELMTLRTEAKAGDWPWAVAVHRSNKYIGGGSIISHSVVITSAYVLFNKTANKITVVAGTSDPADVNQTGRQKVQATELILHPGYRSPGEKSIDNIGIIKVKQMTFSDYVQPVCIGEPHYGKTSSTVVTGFGNSNNQRRRSRKLLLRSIDTEIQTDHECRNTFDHYNELKLCGGYGPKSNLNPGSGDSGSGLVVSTTGHNYKTTWFLRGIQIECKHLKNGHCNPNKYVTYTNVAMYLGWINYHTVQ